MVLLLYNRWKWQYMAGAGAGAGAKIRGKGGAGTLEKEVKFFTLKFFSPGPKCHRGVCDADIWCCRDLMSRGKEKHPLLCEILKEIGLAVIEAEGKFWWIKIYNESGQSWKLWCDKIVMTSLPWNGILIACYIEYVFCKKRKLKLANIFKTLIYLVRSGFGPGRLEKSDPERAKKSPSFILFF